MIGSRLVTWARTALTGLAAAALSRLHGKGVWLGAGGSVPRDYPANWWQRNMPIGNSADHQAFAPAYACINIISQDISRIPLQHLTVNEEGKRVPVLNKAPARIFRKPNRYQSSVDFLLYLARSVLTDGNAYAIPIRNERKEVAELYPVHPAACWPYIEPQSREIFYQVSLEPTTEIGGLDNRLWYPQRDVLHIRGHTPRHPLIGESPLVAAMYPIMTGTSINASTAAFFSNQSRPSGILRHPGRLEEPAMKRIKERFLEVTSGDMTGAPVVLAEGMDWTQLTMSAVDAEIIKTYELSEKQLFQIYRVPPFLGGDMQKSTFNSVETLIRFYLLSCLAFYETLFEQAMTLFFNMPAPDRVSFDVEGALLTGDLKERMEALGAGITKGVLKPNEARERVELPPVEGGDDLFMQQQMVPVGFHSPDDAPTPEETERRVTSNFVDLKAYVDRNRARAA